MSRLAKTRYVRVQRAGYWWWSSPRGVRRALRFTSNYVHVAYVTTRPSINRTLPEKCVVNWLVCVCVCAHGLWWNPCVMSRLEKHTNAVWAENYLYNLLSSAEMLCCGYARAFVHISDVLVCSEHVIMCGSLLDAVFCMVPAVPRTEGFTRDEWSISKISLLFDCVRIIYQYVSEWSVTV